MIRKHRLVGCILGGAIGDAWGSAYENVIQSADTSTFYLGAAKEKVESEWSFTDDTQLTLITLEALLQTSKLTPDVLAERFVLYYQQKRVTGIGSSTLKAFQELAAGGHWSQVGRSGEYAAGNGAAMRIAPIAFWNNYSREEIRSFCRITHRNEEAYAGALAITIAIQQALNGNWDGKNHLIEHVVPHLPDSGVRDKLIQFKATNSSTTIADVAKSGTSGYVVHSVPFAIYCASQVGIIGMNSMYEQIIKAGGDTDTNASMAGQIAGTLLGETNIPSSLKEKVRTVSGFSWISEILLKANERL